MYCWNCGKQIEEDSVFCKYCGKMVVSGTPLSQNKGIYTRFLELSKRKQIALILYGIWFLGWLCFLFGNASDRNFFDDTFLPFFFFTIVMPFIILGVRHIYHIKKKKNKTSHKIGFSHLAQSHIQPQKITAKEPILQSTAEDIFEDKQQSSEIVLETRSQILSSEPLLNFVQANGKMQVVNKKNSDSNYDRYCQFTSEEGKTIRVEFSDRIGFLSSKEISAKKYELLVNKLIDGTYCLDFKEEKQIDDS